MFVGTGSQGTELDWLDVHNSTSWQHNVLSLTMLCMFAPSEPAASRFLVLWEDLQGILHSSEACTISSLQPTGGHHTSLQNFTIFLPKRGLNKGRSSELANVPEQSHANVAEKK